MDEIALQTKHFALKLLSKPLSCGTSVTLLRNEKDNKLIENDLADSLLR